MGEVTDITEPMSSEDVATKNVHANEPSKDKRRKRKKHLYKTLRELLEFYLGDVNLSKDRFMSQRIQGKPYVYVDLATFLTFNKVRALTSSIEDLAKAISDSKILQVSEDGTQVCRKTPIRRKENEDDCTIYVEQLGPDVDHDLLIKVFSEFGPVDYVSLPRFPHNGKFKGFAFVEFKDPVTTAKVLEAFNARGSCLSPHMAPEELMSIKNFDPNKENKKEESINETENAQYQHFTDDDKGNGKHSCGAVESENSENECKGKTGQSHNYETVIEETTIKKENRKRKHSEEKRLKSKELEDGQVECSKGIKDSKKGKNHSKTVNDSLNSLTDTHNDTKEKDDSKSALNKKNHGKKKGKFHDKSIDKPVDDIKEKEAVEDEEQSNEKIKKRKRVSDAAEKADNDSGEPVTKKLKSETEDDTEAESSQAEGDAGDDETVKQKKKRRKKKKVKKDKSSAISLGLKVLPKREWKQLRNKYLNMQREMMRSLKQHLMSKKKSAVEERGSKKENKIKPGTVVKVTLEEPVSDSRAVKSEMRVHPDICYIDTKEGSTYVYLRTTTPDVAAAIIQAKHWPSMELIQGDEEMEYWHKMKMDREDYLKKGKSNQRGRTKLLKRAERFEDKHITTFETS